MIERKKYNKEIQKLLRKPDKEQFLKDYDELVKKNQEIVKKGNQSQLPNNRILSIRFT